MYQYAVQLIKLELAYVDDQSIEQIKKNLDNLGIKHDNFVYESELIKNEFLHPDFFATSTNLRVFDEFLLPTTYNISH